VFSFNKVGSACGALSRRSPVAIGSSYIWPTQRTFFRFDGSSVAPMECPVWDFFFLNADFTQTEAIFAAPNSLFNEVAWYFPMNDGSGRYAYVKLNYVEDVWDYGILYRTAWTDVSPAGNPMGVDQNGAIQQHEAAVDANGTALGEYIRTGYFDVQDGDGYVSVDMIIPDFVISPANASLQIKLFVTDYPGDAPRQYGPYTVQPGTEYFTTRFRGRQAAIEIGSSSPGTFWRLGAVRYRWYADGAH
jgi:hypothetical protein